jgi:hypothetical protein
MRRLMPPCGNTRENCGNLARHTSGNFAFWGQKVALKERLINDFGFAGIAA